MLLVLDVARKLGAMGTLAICFGQFGPYRRAMHAVTCDV
jgi:hypothetical protein